jgi:hypothetical protein
MTDSLGVASESRNDSLAARLRALSPELRNAGIASTALAVSLVLPWYQKSFIPPGARQFAQANLSAFGVFSFVEAAVLLVAAGVIYLVWARANRRAFHLPGGDGTVIMAAGGWALVLLVWRLFDKPGVKDPSGTVGIQWGIFVAFVAAGALMAAGARVRAAHRPEPPNPVAEEDEWSAAVPRPRRADRRPRDASAVTEVLRDPPAWSGEPPPAPPPAGPRDARADPSEAETRVDPRRDDPPDDRLF